MKSISALLEFARRSPIGDRLALATVVEVHGSAYRRPGARMLMNAGGASVGLISGGCLDGDLRERARKVIASGEPQLVTYDSTAPADVVLGLGLGCHGIVQVLIEAVTPDDQTGFLPFLQACADRRQMGRLATVFRSDTIEPGARVLRWPDGTVSSAHANAAVTAALLAALHETAAKPATLRELSLPDGCTASVLLETVFPPVPLIIFGAGDDAVPVARLARTLGWHVTVVDPRPASATATRFPTADAVHCLRPEALLESVEVTLPPAALVLVMTHHFTHDREFLRLLLRRPLGYLGILGPKSRTARLLEEIGEEDREESERPPIHAPAGLDLGAETPEEIAVSVIAEMQAVLARRSGGFLHHRDAPIHDPVETPLPAL